MHVDMSGSAALFCRTSCPRGRNFSCTLRLFGRTLSDAQRLFPGHLIDSQLLCISSLLSLLQLTNRILNFPTRRPSYFAITRIEIVSVQRITMKTGINHEKFDILYHRERKDGTPRRDAITITMKPPDITTCKHHNRT